MMRALLVLTCVVACGGAPKVVTPTGEGDYAGSVPDAGTWRALAQRAGNAVVARVEVVKTVYDRDDSRLYFLQSRRWPIHYDFARRFLSTRILDHEEFNDREYHADDRRFVLGTLTHYLDQDAWTFELFAGDLLSIDATARMFRLIQRATFFGDRLKYRPVPEAHVAALARVRAAMPVLTSEELFASVQYQPIEIGDAWGYLRIVPAGAPPPRDVRPYDVVVLGTQPLELVPVAAIVTDELQAPLGHLAVLAHSRGTPNMALKGASLDARFVALADKPVHLHVGPNDFTIDAITPEELARRTAAKRAKAPTLVLDMRDVGMRNLREIKPADVARFGAKTAQLARVAPVKGVHAPRAFGVPFHAYAEFLAANGLDRKIRALLGDPQLRHDITHLRDVLEKLRAEIAAAPVPRKITDALLARIRSDLVGSKMVRLRSSTNAEDLDGFSGAGLYRSTRVDPTNRDDVERGLREVWASVWSWEAFAEREWYGVDHAKVAMAILVQESIDDDVASGVAITGNPYFEGRPAIYINTQGRGGSVTSATGNEVPEQLLVYVYDASPSVEQISSSSRTSRRLLGERNALTFATQLVRIHEAFVDEPVGSQRAVDVEFLVRSNGEIVIVQARPYRLSWSDDRRSP